MLRELAEGYSVEDILACTEADVIVPDENWCYELIIDAGKHHIENSTVQE